MERYVVGRELAEKLKEAGYTQKGEFMWYNNWMHGDRWEVVSMRGIVLRDKECIAPMLDELRVFALELIGPEPDSASHADWALKMFQLGDALIQGCDATAEFILKTFGEK